MFGNRDLDSGRTKCAMASRGCTALSALLGVFMFHVACAGGDISISWNGPIELGPGGYARVHRLSDGRLMAAYERRGDLMVRFCERGCVDRWTEPQCAARGFAVTNASGAVRVNLVNAEFAQLATGRILLACNMRPAGKKADVHPYAIAIAASDDAGANWSPLKIVYKGRESADGVVRGCYEPFILPLSGGAAQMYYADETPYTEGRSKYQEISIMETADGGETWSSPRTASYAPKRRDGMPVVLQMGEWRYLAIEANPARTRLHPQIIRSRIADNWREVVGAPSKDRFEPFREPRNWEEHYGGAPYIAATENYILLSWQECADCGEFATFRTKACVAAMPKAEVGDGRITAMRGVSTPPRQDGAKMRWNALCPLGGDRFLLVSDVEGKIVLWPGRVAD